MAGTGSDDGSREVAEQYADTVIDFPWTNDFNYYSYDFSSSNYSDFFVARILNLSTGIRYQGVIHELWSMQF